MYNTVRHGTLRVCALCNVHGQCTVDIVQMQMFFVCFHTLVKGYTFRCVSQNIVTIFSHGHFDPGKKSLRRQKMCSC
jgi:hypothetical protein